MSSEQNSSINSLTSAYSGKRFNTFVSFPKRPKNLHPEIEQDKPLLTRPSTAAPRKRIFLFSAEWAWSPMNNRLNHFYLNPNQTGWLLWSNYTEDGNPPWTWHWELLAYGSRCKAHEKTIATHLLLEFWKWEAEHNLAGHYDKVSRSGLFSTAEVNTIARKVWKDG